MFGGGTIGQCEKKVQMTCLILNLYRERATNTETL